MLKRHQLVKITQKSLDDSDEKVRADIIQSAKEMHLIEQGKLKSRPAREFLKEI